MNSQKTLSLFLKIQALSLLGYGLMFFLLPDFTFGAIFAYSTPSFFPRELGAAFIGLAWLEYLIDRRLEERMDLVWPFVLAGALLFAGLIWERAAGTYDGSDLFFWVSIVLTAFFTVTVGGLRYAVKER